MRTLFWRFVGNPHPVGGIRVTFAPGGARLAAVKDATWAEVQKQLPAKGIAIE